MYPDPYTMYHDPYPKNHEHYKKNSQNSNKNTQNSEKKKGKNSITTGTAKYIATHSRKYSDSETIRETTMTTKKKTPEAKADDPSGKPAPQTPFGKLIKFVFELTYILTILIFGTLVGGIFAVILPFGFPLVILYKRYVS